MDHQPRYNRILGYQPESNRATFELAPDQYGSVGVINCAKTSAQDPGLPELTLTKHSQWQSGRSIRINPLGDQSEPITPADSQGVYHRNCMWFDVEIDKQYLDDIAASHVDTILRGNISDNMIHSAIWWPVNEGPPDFTGSDTVVGPDRPENPEYGDVWVETETLPGDPLAGTGQNDVPVRIWTYTKIIGYIDQGTPNEVILYDWEIVYGNENSQGLYNTTTINDIPTYVFNSAKQCRFVVQVHWNQNYANTVTDREVALYVFKGDTDSTRTLNDYIVKSPIVRMRNQANPGPSEFNEPTQKGFVPAELLGYYFDPRFKNLSIPITHTEIVMDILSGTANIDPNDEYENAVFIDLVGEDAELKLNYGAGSEAWVMAPVDDGVVAGNFPYYIGEFDTGNSVWGPTTQSGTLTLSGAGRYAVYGPDAILPITPEIAQWLEDNNFPPRDYEPQGYLTQVRLENTQKLSNITSWDSILRTTGRRMFRNVTGDFNLPESQAITDLTEMFENASDFTDPGNDLPTWFTDTVTSMSGTFRGCVNYNSNPKFNTQNVTTMTETFKGCEKFNSNINDWNVSKVTDMFGMFEGCEVFDQPLGAWDTSKVLNMGNMFAGCSVYDQFIAAWDVQNIQQKPTGFDTGTTPDWTDFEKPWWGALDRPNSEKYITLDIQNNNLILRTQGYTRIKVFRFDRSSVATISNNSGINETYINSNVPVAVFGQTLGMGFGNKTVKNLADQLKTDIDYAMHDTQEWKFINGTSLAQGIPAGGSDTHYNKTNIQADIDQHLIFDRAELDNLLNTINTETVLGDNNDWTHIFDICKGMCQGAFTWMGRLPNDIPDYLVFGWQNADQLTNTNIMTQAFCGCANIPDQSITQTWRYYLDQSEIDLDSVCAFMPDTQNTNFILGDIFNLTEKISASRMFQGSVMQNFNMLNTDVDVINLNQTFRYCDLNLTQGKTQITDCDITQNNTWQQAFLFTHGSDSFLSDLDISITQPDTDLSYMFAYADNSIREITNWDFTLTSDISCMFYRGKFPDVMDNVDLNLYNLGMDEQGRQPDYDYNSNFDYVDLPNSRCHHVFTGCRGTATSMSNWVLPRPKSVNLKGIHYRDVLIPWWFAGCTEFDTDISSWQTTPAQFHPGANTDDEIRNLQVSVFRIGTFAYCENFNSNIDWYFPDAYYFPLSHNTGMDLCEQTDFGVSTYKAIQYNTIESQTIAQSFYPTKIFDTMMYGRTATNHIWWRTFQGAEKFNNGGDTIKTIQASDMVDTFRSSGIDSDITIRKPLWGKAYYQGVFEDTTAWTQPREIDFECQNRSDTPELENVYYHSIFAQRMFKNSTFGGTLGQGFKWFWFNVSNVNGSHFNHLGLNKEFMSWSNYSELQDLRNRLQAGTLGDIQTNTVTDSFGDKAVYNNKVMKTTVAGPNRAPQGNLTDTEAEYNSMDPYASRSQNAGMVDMMLPPEPERFMSDYAIRPLWTAGYQQQYYNYVRYTDNTWYLPDQPIAWVMRDSQGRSKFGLYNYREPRTPVEITNLSEMFAGATNFTQDLSQFRTRWSPPSGAFMLPEDAPGGAFWPGDDYYGRDITKPQTTFNRRAESDELAFDTDYGDLAIVIEGNLEWGAGTTVACSFTHFYDDFPPGYNQTQSSTFNSNLVGFQITPYDIQVVINYHDPLGNPSFTCAVAPEYEYFRAIPGVTMTVDQTNVSPGKAHTRTVLDAEYKWKGVVYKSLSSETYIIKQGQTLGAGRQWCMLKNPTADITTLQPGDEFDAVAMHYIRDNADGLIAFKNDKPKYAWLPLSWTPGQEGADVYDPVYKQIPGVLLQNGHVYNKFGNLRRSLSNQEVPSDPYEKLNPGPDKSDMDYFYTDNQATDTDKAPTFGIAGSETTLYHGIQTEPKNFATGAVNFTSDKWPTWMVGYSDQPQSVTDIENHFAPDNVRTTGDSRYITNYAWTHEPYNWPDGDIYRNDEY